MVRHEGELARGALEARGLQVILAADDCGSMHPALGLATGGPKLYVEESRIEEASEILEGKLDGDSTDDLECLNQEEGKSY